MMQFRIMTDSRKANTLGNSPDFFLAQIILEGVVVKLKPCQYLLTIGQMNEIGKKI